MRTSNPVGFEISVRSNDQVLPSAEGEPLADGTHVDVGRSSHKPAPFTEPAVAAPISGTNAAALEGKPVPTIRPVPNGRLAARIPGAGRRSPLALLAVALVAVAWLLRTRTAVAAAGDHPLAAPLSLRGAIAATSLTEER